MTETNITETSQPNRNIRHFFPRIEPAELDTLWILCIRMESAIASSREENLQKLMVIMRPSESGVVHEDGCVTSFDVQCLTLIAGSESIISNVQNMSSMGLHYLEQKKNFIELRLNLLRQLMEHYLTLNSRDDFMGSKYRDFMIK